MKIPDIGSDIDDLMRWAEGVGFRRALATFSARFITEAATEHPMPEWLAELLIGAGWRVKPPVEQPMITRGKWMG